MKIEKKVKFRWRNLKTDSNWPGNSHLFYSDPKFFFIKKEPKLQNYLRFQTWENLSECWLVSFFWVEKWKWSFVLMIMLKIKQIGQLRFFSTDSSFLKNSPDGKNLWKGSEDLRFIFQKEEGNNTEKLTY